MNLVLISILAFLFISTPCFIIIRSFILTGRQRAQASREYTAMIECIKAIDTVAEYQFWLQESNSFINRYVSVVSPPILNMYEVSINTALRKRFNEGFDKSIIPDNN